MEKAGKKRVGPNFFVLCFPNNFEMGVVYVLDQRIVRRILRRIGQARKVIRILALFFAVSLIAAGGLPTAFGESFVLGPMAASAAADETNDDASEAVAPEAESSGSSAAVDADGADGGNSSAEAPPEASGVARPRPKLGLGASLRAPGVPFLSAALHTDNWTLSIEGIAAEHSLFGIDARTQV